MTLSQSCPACGARTICVTEKEELFEYGVEEPPVKLSATMPVWTCKACEFTWIDHRGMEIQHETVCKYLGRIAPREIKQLMEREGFSDERLAEILATSPTHIQKLTRGALIQGESEDQHLRLLIEVGFEKMAGLHVPR